MLDFGMPMGPMRLMDEVGIDVCAHFARHQARHLAGGAPMPGVLDRMAEQGHLGRKGGRGFYVYGGKKVRPNEEIRALARSRDQREFGREEMAVRMALLMVNEAARCLEEGLASGPEDIDFAMIMGAGFAPFRGGPLRHADALGLGEVAGALTSRADAGERHFAPCELLLGMAEAGRFFYPTEQCAS
jgi:3-hydroxyacyl-CoA dehydrogenase/enoyl-CoA hydratase/3-hydroxybutyryl-CoA epimerase